MATIDKALLKTIRPEINAALKELGDKYGIDLTAEGARFNADSATFKLELTTRGEGGESRTKESIALEANFPELVNKKVSMQGEDFVVIGYNSRASKNKFQIKQTSGRGKGKIYVTTGMAVGAAGIGRF